MVLTTFATSYFEGGDIGFTLVAGGSCFGMSGHEDLLLLLFIHAVSEKKILNSETLQKPSPAPHKRLSNYKQRKQKNRAGRCIMGATLTVVSRSRAPNLSSWAAADFSNASCFLIRFSTSSMLCPSSVLIRYGSCAINQASATAASLAN